MCTAAQRSALAFGNRLWAKHSRGACNWKQAPQLLRPGPPSYRQLRRIRLAVSGASCSMIATKLEQ